MVRRKDANEEAYRRLRDRYEVVVEPPPAVEAPR
jgi:hypothetical protein